MLLLGIKYNVFVYANRLASTLLFCRKLSNSDRQYIFEVGLVLLGAWFGTIPFILDWDRQWQVCTCTAVQFSLSSIHIA